MNDQSTPQAHLGTIAVIEANVHHDMVAAATRGLTETIGTRGTIERHMVPGAFELPLHAQTLARSARCAAIVAVGFVVDGGVYRHEFVADAVISGLMRVSLDTEVPVLSCVLTPQRFHDHDDHRDFFLDHMHGKGIEVGSAAVELLDGRRALQLT